MRNTDKKVVPPNKAHKRTICNKATSIIASRMGFVRILLQRTDPKALGNPEPESKPSTRSAKLETLNLQALNPRFSMPIYTPTPS